MDEEGQTGLAEFADPGPDDPGGGERPEAEAEAIAGHEQVPDAVVDPRRARMPDAEGTVEIAVTQVDYTIVGSGKEERPVVHVFGRTTGGDFEHVRVDGFRPYFYAPTDTLDEAQLDHDRITGTEQGYESIRGRELTRIYGQTPRDVGQIREDFEHYEADILFPNRLLIDKDIRGGMSVPERRTVDGTLVVTDDELEPADVTADPRLLTLDIEVDDRRGFPEDGEEPIVCLTTHDSYDDEYVAWLYRAPDGDAEAPAELSDYEPIRGDAEIRVESFESEPAMLDAVISYLERKDQDVLTGWNCLPAEAHVLLADGTETPIEDVRVGDAVVGSEDRQPSVATVTDKWESETRIYEFELGDGTSLRSSADHRVMVDDEGVDWKRGGDIEAGDYLLKPRTLTVEDPVVPALSEFVSTDDAFSAPDSVPVADGGRSVAANARTGPPGRERDPNRTPTPQDLYVVGRGRSSDVDLSSVYRLPEEYVAGFLAGVLDGSETVTSGDSGVSIPVADAIREEWLAKLFKRLGIYARPQEGVVRVSDRERDVERLANRVLPHASDPETVAGLEALERQERPDGEPSGTDTPTSTGADRWNEYVFVAVEAVRERGVETTYDIETTTHDFVAEGCLVHNCDDFDIPYVLDRMERLDDRPSHDYDLSVERLSRVDEVWRSNWGGPDLKGRVVFDLLYAYKRTQFTELESYRLDAVGEMELGVGKERYPGDIGDLWEDDPGRLLEYNVRDVELCVEINEEQDVIPFWMEVASFVGCLLEDATTPGDAVDMYVLHEAYGKFALPSKGQQETEEFEGGAVFDPITGVRDNVAVLDLKCFSGDTDLVTPEGIRNIRDLSVGDPVYTLDPETFECEIQPVVDTQSYDNRYGELHHLQGEGHDLKVTENHGFLVSNAGERDALDPADYEYREYRDLPETTRFAFPHHEPASGTTRETFRLDEPVVDEVEVGNANVDGVLADGRGRRVPRSFEMDDWLELMGRTLVMGTRTPGTSEISFDARDPDARGAMRNLLEQMGIEYTADLDGIVVSSVVLCDWFDEQCGGENEPERLPEWVFELDAEQLVVLLEAFVGDGNGDELETPGERREHGERGSGAFRTGSERLKDDLARLAVRCGYRPTVTKRDDGTWTVSIAGGGAFDRETNATVEDHDGRVHCVTARDNHVVLAGRNGRFQWVGQSLYPMSMTTINASPETKVDPEEYGGETYHTPNNVHFRKEPDGIIRKMVDELLDERDEKKALRDDHAPGSEDYVRYDRQQRAVKVIMNCFTPDTEVLTPEGVRNIRDLTVGDEVYSLDPDSMSMEVKTVVETHEYPDYRGELVDIQTSKIDFRVTPNHRMLVRKDETNGSTWPEDDYRFVEAGNLDDATNYRLPSDWKGPDGDPIEEVDLVELLDRNFEVWADNEIHGHTIASEIGWYPKKVQKADLDTTGYVFSADEFREHREYLEANCTRFRIHAEPNRKWVPRYYDGDQFLDLLAWYITEGSVYTSEKKQFGENFRGSATTVSIAQERSTRADGGRSDHEAIGRLLDSMGFDYNVDERGYQFTSKLLGDLLERLCGSDSHQKRIPELVFEATRDQKLWFLETLVDGDGDRQKGSWRYTTASECLRDDVLRLCAHVGLTANYAKDSGVWHIYVTEGSRNTLRMHRSSERTTAENGVYCVTIEDNHTLLAGRNGKFQFVGQSLYGVFGWDRFRLYDRQMSSGVTATNRDVIRYTQQTVNDLGYEVVYGDSVTGDRPVVVRDSDGMIRVVPIENLFGRARPIEDGASLLTTDGGAVRKRSHRKRYRELDGWEALSLADDGTAEWRPISLVIRHETDKPLVQLRHERGESTTTPDHSYVVSEHGELVEATPDEVDDPLRIPEIPPVETVESVDIDQIPQDVDEVPGAGSDAATGRCGRENGVVDLTGEQGKALIRSVANEVAKYSTDDSENRTTGEAQLPSFVFHLPDRLQDLFVETVAEHGSRPPNRRADADERGDRTHFEATSRRVAAGISTLLIQRGADHSVDYRDSTGSYVIRTSDLDRRDSESSDDPVVEKVEVDGDRYVYDLSVEETQNFVDGVGGLVLHNTDSVMIEHGPDRSVDDVIDLSFDIAEEINDSYDDFASETLDAERHRFEIEFEKLYRRFFQAGKKKRYAGRVLWKENKRVDEIDITGFEYKRSDIAPITKEVQREVIEMIVTGEDVSAIKSHVSDVIDEFKAGNVDLDEVGIPGGIGKRLTAYDTDTAQVRGAKYANLLLGTNFGRGSKPKRLYLAKNGIHPDYLERIDDDIADDPLYESFKRDVSEGDGVICFEYEDQVPEEFEVDWDKMLEKTIEQPIAPVLAALDVSWEEIETGQKQTGLGQYMD